MKITTETLPERQVRLQIEVDAERHAQAVEEAYRRLAPRVQVAGFRPGKAPRPLIERHLGRHRLLDEAMDILLPKVYGEAIEQEKLEPVASPAVELVSHEPFIFTATVPLQPIVELGDYLSLRVPRQRPTVTDEQVEEALTDLRRRYGTIEPVDRPAQKGDVIRGDLRAEVDGEALFSQEGIEYRLTDESLASLPGLADAIVGLRKGDSVERAVQVAEDFGDSRLAGKTAVYKIAVHDVKEEKLAPLDDSFAKEVGEGFESLAALRQRIREDLQRRLDEAALHEYEHAVVDALVAMAKLEYPAVLVEREIDHILEEQARLDPRDPRAQLLYLQRLGKSEQEVRDSVRTEAEQSLRRSLVMSEFAAAENIAVADADVDAELQSLAASAGDQSAAVLEVLGSESGRESLRRSLFARRVLARLVEIAGQEEEAKRKPAKQRRTAPRRSEE